MTRGQILVGLAVLLSARLAIAATAPVVIVRAERTPPVVADALRRVAAELALHEFSVVTVAAERSPSCALLRVIGDERQAVGAIALAESQDDGISVMTLDRHAGTCVEQLVRSIGAPDAAPELALRSFEALRAHFLERELRAKADAKADANTDDTAAAPVAIPAAPAAPPEPSRWLVRVGAAGRLPQPAQDVAWTPSFAVLRTIARWRVGVAIAPASTAWRIDDDVAGSGDARVRAGFVTAERRFGTSRARAFVAAAGGVVAVTARGDAAAPARGLERTLVTPAAQVSGGVEASISSRLALVATVGVELWRSTPVVQLREVDRRALSNPIVMAGIAAAMTFGGP